ncbi:MAG: twin-arginine translocase subunit TatC [Bacteroidales bacterium]|nr:twin-arginine translocase subunit TatC [Bacteroidales bacterium]
MAEKDMTFWEHLDELRKVLFRSALLLFAVMLVMFFLKDFMFQKIVFAPTDDSFPLYRLTNYLLEQINRPPLEPFSLKIINIDLPAQFYVHLSTSFYFALVICTPIIIYFIWTFVAPALYPKERRSAIKAFTLAGVFFYTGVIVGYYLLFPLALRFLGTYQVSPDVANQISLKSYISSFFTLILLLGIVFELPTVMALLSKFGIIWKSTLKKYRRHAFVVLMILAALITPSDPFTMMAVGLPLYALYEVSIMMCRNKPLEQ